MDTGLSPNDPTIRAAFRAALLHQGLIAAGALVMEIVLLRSSRRAGRSRAGAW